MRRLNVGSKLILGFTAVVILLWLIAILASNSYNSLNQQFLVVEEEVVAHTLYINNVESTAGEAYRGALDYVLHGTEEAKANTLSHLDSLLELNNSGQLLSSDNEDKFAAAVQQFSLAINTVITTKEGGAGLDDLMVMDQIIALPALLSLQQAAATEKTANNEALAAAKADFSHTYNASLHSILIGIALITLTAMLAAYFTTRSIIRPLNKLRSGAEIIAKGDLSYKVGTDASDEIGQLSRAFDRMTEGLTNTMTSIDNLNKEMDERKRVEKALQRSEEKFRALFENAKDGILLADIETGRLIDVNPAGCALLGLPKEKIIGMHQSEIHPEGMAEQYKELFRQHMVQGSSLSQDMLVQHADGRHIPVDISASIIKLDGRPVMQGVYRDITGRKRTQAALRESEERFSKAFRSNPHAMSISTRQDGVFLEVNDSFLRVFGYTREEVIGKSSADLKLWVNPQDRVRIMARMDKKGRVDNEEYLSHTKSGEIRTMLFSAEPVTLAGQDCVISVTTDITERRQVEEDLRASQEFSDSLLENSPLQIVVVNPDTSVRYVNPKFEEVNGWKLAEIIGTKAPYPWWPDEMKTEEGIAAYKEALGTDAAQIESLACKKNGELYWLDLNWTAVKKDGELQYCLISSTDITERKKIEEDLKESEEKFSKAFRSSPNTISIVTLDEGRFIEVNDSFTDVTGYAREETVGHTVKDINIWANPADRNKMLQILKKDGRVHNHEFDFRIKSGEVRTWLFSAELIDIGDEPYMISMTTDISELKKASEAVRESEKFSTSLMKSSAIPILVINADTSIRYVNPSFEELTGFTLADVVGKKAPLPWWLEDQVEENMDRLEKSLRKGFRSVEMLFQKKNGEQFWVEVTAVPVKRKGKFVYTLANWLDVTERRRMETELRVHRDHLGELVRERTAELTEVNKKLEHELKERQKAEVALITAKNEAENANQAKSEFLARTSHEIRTPIHGVMGTINLVLDSHLEPEQRQYLKMSMASAESLLNIINDILDLSKIESGQLEPEREVFSLRNSLEDILDSLAVSANKKGLELTCRIMKGVPAELVGDTRLLRQIMINLVGNSIKFTTKGEVAVAVETLAESETEAELQFTVQDTGIGISKDKLEVIFEPFQQADGSINRQYGGTGLGLTISRHLIDQMGGRIWVESLPGKGSTFHFTGKFAKPKKGEPSGNGAKKLPVVNRVPLLLVDDNATNRLTVRDMLEDCGFVVTDVDCAEAALQAIRRAGKPDRYRVIMLDKTLEDRDGFAVAADMIKHAVSPSEIIMMLPPHSVSDDFSRCQKLGISNYVTKPVKQAQLQQALRGSLGMAPGEKEKEKRAAATADDMPCLRILVAEDNPTSQLIARKTLEKMGHSVTVANNGSEAVKMSAEDKFDLILMDAEMPVLNGLEATRLIRKREGKKGPRIPIVAMTAYAMKEDKNRCLKAGMDGYLSKPAKPEEIRDIIGKLFAGKKTARNARPASPAPAEEAPAVDAEAARQVFGDDEELLVEAVTLFLEEDCPRQLKLLQEGIENQDAPAVRAAAHSIKGAARSLGGMVLGDAAFRLEEMARDGKLDGAAELAETIEAELKRFADHYTAPARP